MIPFDPTAPAAPFIPAAPAPADPARRTLFFSVSAEQPLQCIA
jgi:hypothetical protein